MPAFTLRPSWCTAVATAAGAESPRNSNGRAAPPCSTIVAGARAASCRPAGIAGSSLPLSGARVRGRRPSRPLAETGEDARFRRRDGDAPDDLVDAEPGGGEPSRLRERITRVVTGIRGRSVGIVTTESSGGRRRVGERIALTVARARRRRGGPRHGLGARAHQRPELRLVLSEPAVELARQAFSLR